MTFWPALPQFQNYYIAWTKGGFSVYLPNSAALLARLPSLAILLAASMAGYALARIEFPGRSGVMFLIMAIIIVPLPATFIALYKLLVDIGLANTRPGYILAHGRRRPADLDLHPARLLHAPAEGARGRGDPGRLFGVRRLLAGDAAAGPAGLAAVAVIEFLRLWNEYLLALVMFNSDALMPVQRGLTQVRLVRHDRSSTSCWPRPRWRSCRC